MKKTAVWILLAGLSAAAAGGGQAAQEKKTQFALALGVMDLANRGDESKVIAGLDGLVIFNLGRRIMIMPEARVGSTGFFTGLTLNVRLGRIFIGAGGEGGKLYDDPHEWSVIGLLKVQAGLKGPHFLAAAAYVDNLNPGNWPTLSGFSLMVGYIF
jgi:hypothetical protein